MKSVWLLGLFAASSVLADAAFVPIVVRNAQSYVNSKDLEQTIGIAIKSLPGEKKMVACYRERCATLEGRSFRCGGFACSDKFSRKISGCQRRG